MKVILIDRRLAVTAWLEQAFEGTDAVCVCDGLDAYLTRCGDQIDCIATAGNGYGILDGGYDLAVKRYFGDALQRAVQDHIRDNYHGEQPVGTSFLIPIPGSDKYLAHTPTMRVPSPICDAMTVYHAFRATLLAAQRQNVRTILVPAFGAGCGGIRLPTLAQMLRMAYDQVFSPVPQTLDWNYAFSHRPEDLRPPLPERRDD